jgi:uncharacterized coiled-coil DUF342 family protein
MSQTRDTYVQKMKAQLDRWNEEIDRLAARAAEVKADAREEYRARIEDLRTKRHVAEGKLDELRHSGEEAWSDLKAGMELAWESLGEAVKSAAAKFK